MGQFDLFGIDGHFVGFEIDRRSAESDFGHLGRQRFGFRGRIAPRVQSQQISYPC